MTADAVLDEYNVAPERRAFYAGLTGLDDPSRLLDNARILADRNPRWTKKPLANFLFENRRRREINRETWDRDVIVAKFMYPILYDFFRLRDIRSLDGSLDTASITSATEALTSPNGTLVLASHVGFWVPTMRFAFDCLEECEIILGGRQHVLSAKANSGAALFAAHRALREGRQTFIAVDGPNGRRSGMVSVMGVDFPIAQGAHFLAYETGCNTAWLNFTHDGERFVACVEPGPRRDGPESAKEFAARLNRFCEENIANCLSGDPKGLCLNGQWTDRFSALIAEQAKRQAAG